MTITVLVSVTSHVVVADICNFLPPSVLFTLCLLQAPQLDVVLYLVE